MKRLPGDWSVPDLYKFHQTIIDPKYDPKTDADRSTDTNKIAFRFCLLQQEISELIIYLFELVSSTSKLIGSLSATGSCDNK